jgi:hypothetical protein
MMFRSVTVVNPEVVDGGVSGIRTSIDGEVTNQSFKCRLDLTTPPEDFLGADEHSPKTDNIHLSKMANLVRSRTWNE